MARAFGNAEDTAGNAALETAERLTWEATVVLGFEKRAGVCLEKGQGEALKAEAVICTKR